MRSCGCRNFQFCRQRIAACRGRGCCGNRTCSPRSRLSVWPQRGRAVVKTAFEPLVEKSNLFLIWHVIESIVSFGLGWCVISDSRSAKYPGSEGLRRRNFPLADRTGPRQACENWEQYTLGCVIFKHSGLFCCANIVLTTCL